MIRAYDDYGNVVDLLEWEQQIRADAIDEYKDKLCSTLEEYQTGFNMVSMANVWHFSDEIAGQLKEKNK